MAETMQRHADSLEVVTPALESLVVTPMVLSIGIFFIFKSLFQTCQILGMRPAFSLRTSQTNNEKVNCKQV